MFSSHFKRVHTVKKLYANTLKVLATEMQPLLVQTEVYFLTITLEACLDW